MHSEASDAKYRYKYPYKHNCSKEPLINLEIRAMKQPQRVLAVIGARVSTTALAIISFRSHLHNIRSSLTLKEGLVCYVNNIID